jgi:hypothetical protein
MEPAQTGSSNGLMTASRNRELRAFQKPRAEKNKRICSSVNLDPSITPTVGLLVEPFDLNANKRQGLKTCGVRSAARD